MDNEIQAITNVGEFERMLAISTLLRDPAEDQDLRDRCDLYSFRIKGTVDQGEELEGMRELCTTLFIRRLRSLLSNPEYKRALQEERAAASKIVARILESEAHIREAKLTFPVHQILEAVVQVTWSSFVEKRGKEIY